MHMLKVTKQLSCKRKNCGYLFFDILLSFSKRVKNPLLLLEIISVFVVRNQNHFYAFFPLDRLQYGKYLYTSFKFTSIRPEAESHNVTRVCTFSAAAILALQNQVLSSASSSSIFECLSSLSLAATGQCNVSLPTSARFSSAFQ